MGVFLPRNSRINVSRSTSRGSKPVASKSPLLDTLRRPKRRGSMNRNSRPEASFAMAWVCFSIGVSGEQSSMLPVMPKWTIHCATVECEAVNFRVFFRRADFCLPNLSLDGQVTRSRSMTMCLPMRRTPVIRECSRVEAISAAGDFSGSGLEPSQSDSITSPFTRLSSPRAMVSTSGSSGMKS